MNKWDTGVVVTLCGLFVLAHGARNPIRHFGYCNVRDETGYCLHKHNCWEKDVNFQSSERGRCLSQIRNDLVCCRRASAGNTVSPLKQLLPQAGACGGFGDSFADRIIAGTVSSIKDYPWMALLRYTSDGEEYSHLCGGSLINERWVLTAAHCVPSAEANQQLVQVRLGEWNTTSSPDCQQFKTDRVCAPPHIDIPIDRIKVHENYVPQGPANYSNDIALLRLERSVTFSEYIQPICLPAANTNEVYSYTGYAMEIAGWGNTEQIRFGGSPVKMKAVLNVLPMATCREIYPQVISGQLCAGGESPASTCQGDSGGPLMLLEDNGFANSSYYQTGIVSLGSSTCNNRGRPMIFTRVEQYMTWIVGTLSTNN